MGAGAGVGEVGSVDDGCVCEARAGQECGALHNTQTPLPSPSHSGTPQLICCHQVAASPASCSPLAAQ